MGHFKKEKGIAITNLAELEDITGLTGTDLMLRDNQSVAYITGNTCPIL